MSRKILVPAVSLLYLMLLSGCNSDDDAPAGNASLSSAAARTVMIPPGDADCPYGGSLVETGIDENGNGVLDASEVDNTDKVCNGADGSNGLNSLVAITEESAGSNCADGGVRVATGLDADGSGSLEGGEELQVSYVCNAGSYAVVSANETITGSWTFAVTTTLQTITLAPAFVAPATPTAGTIYYDANNDLFCFYEGNSWTLLGGIVATGTQCQ